MSHCLGVPKISSSACCSGQIWESCWGLNINMKHWYLRNMRQRERGNAMLWSPGTIAAESWHGLPCSPLSFTNWQNFLLVMLAPLNTHGRSKPACQSPGSSDAVALQPAWPSCLKNAGYSRTLYTTRPASTRLNETKDLASAQLSLTDKPLLCCFK